MEALNQLSNLEKEKFTAIINKLLTTTFIHKSTDRDYYFVLSHRDLFETVLTLIGWQLNVDAACETIYLTSENNANRYRFSLKETILLLLLRALFEQQAREVSRTNQIIVPISELQARYQTLKLRDKNIDKASLINALATFKRFNIIDVVIQGDNFAGSLIVIHPTILVLIKVQNIKEVYDRIESLTKKGEENATTEEITLD